MKLITVILVALITIGFVACADVVASRGAVAAEPSPESSPSAAPGVPGDGAPTAPVPLDPPLVKPPLPIAWDTLFSDDFNRANNSSPGSSYQTSGLTGSPAARIEISGNRLVFSPGLNTGTIARPTLRPTIIDKFGAPVEIGTKNMRIACKIDTGASDSVFCLLSFSYVATSGRYLSVIEFNFSAESNLAGDAVEISVFMGPSIVLPYQKGDMVEMSLTRVDTTLTVSLANLRTNTTKSFERTIYPFGTEEKLSGPTLTAGNFDTSTGLTKKTVFTWFSVQKQTEYR